MKLNIDPKKTIEELTKNFDYKYVNDSFKLPKIKISKFNYKLLPVEKYIRTDEVETFVKSKGYELTTIREVLEFGNQYPDEQKKNYIFTVENISGQFFYGHLLLYDGERDVFVNQCEPGLKFNVYCCVLVRELNTGSLGSCSPLSFGNFDLGKLEIIYDGKKFKLTELKEE